MTSRLLINIEAEIEQASDGVSADCWRVRRACYLARMGHVDDVKAALLPIRERYDRKPVAIVAVWLNLAEGLACFFGGMDTQALEKIRRAHALALASDIRAMRALCAAWLAHLEFGFLRTDQMTMHLEESLDCADGDAHDALSRASLVVAVALHTSNRYDLAKPWYSGVRLHAAAEGDDATLSALLHNMTSMGVMNLRQAVLTGASESRLALDALMGADSTSNYDSLKGTLSLTTWVPILRAYVASLVGDPKQALVLYREHVEEAKKQGQGRMMPYIHADMAWCQIQTGQTDAARLGATDAERILDANTHVDDRAATHSRLSATYSALGSADLARRHDFLATKAWNEFGHIQSRIVDSLSRLAPKVSRGA